MEQDKFKITLTRVISKMLSEYGIPTNMNGYYYLRSAIYIVAVSDICVINFSSDVYPKIAEEYQSSADTVARSISRAIEKAYRCSTSKMYSEHFDKIYGIRKKPTNSQFIYSLANELQLSENFV